MSVRKEPTRWDHDVAKDIAKKVGGKYNPRKGVDIVTKKSAIEVETDSTISDAKRQLQGQRKPSYIAVTNKPAVAKAVEATKGTTIGVMGPDGRVVKRSTRKRR